MPLKIGTQIAGPDRVLNASNFEETMKALADIGFEGVELTWYPTHYPEEEPFETYFGNSAAEVESIFDSVGLEVMGSHVLLSDLQADLESAIEFHQAAGCDRIGLVEIPENYFESRATLKEAVADVQKMAATMADANMELYLHNHDHEFAVSFDSKSGFEALVNELSDNVPLQIDLSHIKRTGSDPLAVLRDLNTEISSLHVSDMVGTDDVPMGQGEIDYKWVIEFARNQDIDWLVLEEKSSALDKSDALNVLRDDYEYLQGLTQ